MEEKFWKNSKCSSHLDLSNELLKLEFCALGGPESRGSYLQNCQDHIFPAKNLVPRDRCEQKILKKIPKVPVSCINRSCKFLKFSLKSSQMRK